MDQQEPIAPPVLSGIGRRTCGCLVEPTADGSALVVKYCLAHGGGRKDAACTVALNRHARELPAAVTVKE